MIIFFRKKKRGLTNKYNSTLVQLDYNILEWNDVEQWIPLIPKKFLPFDMNGMEWSFHQFQKYYDKIQRKVFHNKIVHE